MKPDTLWLRIGASLMALGVAAGAFGAHGLKGMVTPEMLEIWKTGVSYHLLHALALTVLGASGAGGRATRALFLAGILIFSGTLYLLVLTGHRWLGAITPIGGVSLIGGWCALALRPEPQQ